MKCPRCGRLIHRYTWLGLRIDLDHAPMPVEQFDPATSHTVWERHPDLGWLHAPVRPRGHPIHRAHTCARDTTRRSTSA